MLAIAPYLTFSPRCVQSCPCKPISSVDFVRVRQTSLRHGHNRQDFIPTISDLERACLCQELGAIETFFAINELFYQPSLHFQVWCRFTFIRSFSTILKVLVHAIAQSGQTDSHDLLCDTFVRCASKAGGAS